MEEQVIDVVEKDKKNEIDNTIYYNVCKEFKIQPILDNNNLKFVTFPFNEFKFLIDSKYYKETDLIYNEKISKINSILAYYTNIIKLISDKYYNKHNSSILSYCIDYDIKELPINNILPHKINAELSIYLKDNQNIVKTTICSFNMHELNNCCGALSFSSTKSFINSIGIGNILQYMKEDLAKAQTSYIIQCTDKLSNTRNINLLEKFNWKKVHEFINYNSENKVGVFIKDIDKNLDNKEVISDINKYGRFN